MSTPSPDAHEITEATDLAARYIDRWGVAYPNFVAYLHGQPDQEDSANSRLARYRKEGRSEAFCRKFREGYDQAIAAPSAQPDARSRDEAAWTRAFSEAAYAHEEDFFAVEARLQAGKEARGELRDALTPATLTHLIGRADT